MEIKEIRNQFAELIPNNGAWLNTLNNTEPDNYGVNDWDIQLPMSNIYVDVPSRTFTFRDAELSFNVTLQSSHDGFDRSFDKPASGKGKFEFLPGGKRVKISEMEINADLDLFAE